MRLLSIYTFITLLCVCTGKSSTITVSGTVTAPDDSLAGTLTLTESSAAYSGMSGHVTPFSIDFGALTLPVGAVVSSVSLSLLGAGSFTAPVFVSTRAQLYDYISVYQQVVTGYNYVPYPCGYQNRSTCYASYPIYTQEPVYDSGYAGSASFSATANTTFSNATAGSHTAAVNAGGGASVLSGFSVAELNAGLSVTGTTALALQYNVLNYGYQSSTEFDVSSFFTPGLSGILSVNYTATPEPAAASLLAAGLLCLASAQLLRHLRRSASN